MVIGIRDLESQIKQILDFLKKDDEDLLSKEDKENIAQLMKLLKGGIDASEVKSVIALLGELKDVLNVDFMSDILKQIQNTIREFGPEALDLTMLQEFTSLILEAVMDYLLENASIALNLE